MLAEFAFEIQFVVVGAGVEFVPEVVGSVLDLEFEAAELERAHFAGPALAHYWQLSVVPHWFGHFFAHFALCFC